MAGLIGVFGGTFDPPHVGHLILADEARAALNLDRVLWVVSADPPHKPDKPITPSETRILLVQAALEGDDGFELSRADVDRPGPHYAVGTLAWLSERLPGAEFVYLMGADSLRDLPTWHQPERFVAGCEAIAVMHRPEVSFNLTLLETRIPGLRQKVRLLPAPLVAISSSDIRRRVHGRLPYRYLLPVSVARFIRDHRLYR